MRDAVANFVNANAPAGVKFTTNNVKSAPVVAARQLNYERPSDVLTELENELQWAWYIDYERDVHFFPVESFASPLPGNTLDVDTDLVNYGDLVLTMDATQVGNRIYVLGFQIMSSNDVTDNFAGDGTTTTFNLSQVPAPLAWATADSVTVGGAAYTLATDVASALPGSGAANTAYFNQENQTVRFAAAPGGGVAVVCTYRYLYSPITMVEDPVAQVWWARVTGDDGVYECMLDDSTLSGPDQSLAGAQAQLLLAKYAYPCKARTVGLHLETAVDQRHDGRPDVRHAGQPAGHEHGVGNPYALCCAWPGPDECRVDHRAVAPNGEAAPAWVLGHRLKLLIRYLALFLHRQSLPGSTIRGVRRASC